jgi:DNA-binding transcriptional LysR family regulator
MNFRSLQYFNEVVEQGSIRKAAKVLFVSEQSLSEYIKRLEAEQKTTLLVRTRPQTLTQAGEIFYRYSKEILALKDEMEEKIAQHVPVHSENKLCISNVTMGMPVFLPELLSAFREEYPQYTVEVKEKPFEDSDKFEDGEIGFLPEKKGRSLDYIELKKDYCCVLVSEEQLRKTYGTGWEIVRCRMEEQGDIEILKDLTYIDWKQDKADRFVSYWHRLDESGFQPETVTYSGNFETNLSMCLQGMGALLSMEDMIERSMHLRKIGNEKPVYCFRIRSEKAVSMLTLAYKKGSTLNAAQQAFVSVAQKFFQKKSVNEETRHW